MGIQTTFTDFPFQVIVFYFLGSYLILTYSVVAGNLAKLILERFSKSVIRELLNHKWWNHSDDFKKKYKSFFQRYSC